MKTKICTKCRAEKSLGEFGPTKQQLKGGVRSLCRECEREYKRAWVKKDPVRSLKRVSDWKASNREKVRAWNRDYAKRVRENEPERAALWERRARLKREYGVTIEWFDQQSVEQNGRCAICRELPGQKGLCIDHCHSTGKVRKLLCSQCNTSLHKMECDLGWIRKAEAYLILFEDCPNEDASAVAHHPDGALRP